MLARSSRNAMFFTARSEGKTTSEDNSSACSSVTCQGLIGGGYLDRRGLGETILKHLTLVLVFVVRMYAASKVLDRTSYNNQI